MIDTFKVTKSETLQVIYRRLSNCTCKKKSTCHSQIDLDRNKLFRNQWHKFHVVTQLATEKVRGR